MIHSVLWERKEHKTVLVFVNLQPNTAAILSKIKAVKTITVTAFSTLKKLLRISHF